MSPAITVQYQTVYKKLVFRHKGRSYNLPELIGVRGIKLSELLKRIDGSAKAEGRDPVYIKLYRRIKYLARYKVYDLRLRERVDWNKTNTARMDEIEKSVQTIFANAVKPSPPIVSSGTTPTEADLTISTVKTTEPGFYVVPTGQLLYLFSQVQNSNRVPESANKPTGNYWDRLYNIPAKCATERISAIKTLMELRTRLYQPQRKEWISDPIFRRDLTCPRCGKEAVFIAGKKIASCSCGASFKPPLNRKLKNELGEIQSTFSIWDERTINKELFFDRGPGTSMIKLPCSTRFTDRGRKVKNIRTFDRGWTRANQLYRRGVFLTLTTDPALHKSLWHANRHLSRAWNRYLSILLSRKKQAKKKGYDTEPEEHDQIDNGIGRLKYIAAYEFQENGLIHLHVCFFGIRYLANMEQIAEDWNRCGQGRIAHAYGIRRNGDTWEWNRQKPEDAGDKSPVDYLRKYLEKALYVSEFFPMYWAVNKRFCTMSRIFQTKECAGCKGVWGSGLKVCPDCGGPLRRISQGFRFLGALEKGDSPPAAMMDRNRGKSPFDALGYSGGVLV